MPGLARVWNCLCNTVGKHLPQCHYGSQSVDLMGKISWGTSRSIWVPSSMLDLFNTYRLLRVGRTGWTANGSVATVYEQLSQQYNTYCTEEKLDELFLEASQLLDVEPLNNSMVMKPSGKH